MPATPPPPIRPHDLHQLLLGRRDGHVAALARQEARVDGLRGALGRGVDERRPRVPEARDGGTIRRRDVVRRRLALVDRFRR